jgi:hypothetical protein
LATNEEVLRALFAAIGPQASSGGARNSVGK